MQPGGGGLRNKGFTLIELLAVIIILAVIALISVPIILNIIEKARMSAFKDTVYGIMESAKLEYIEEMMNGRVGEKTYVYPFEELKFSGSKPNGGIIRINENGNVEVAIYNNKWCASNTKENSKVTITNYEEGNCIIKDSAKDPVIILNGESNITLKQGETYQELGVVAKTVDGEELEYTVEMTLDENKVEQIDTSILGTYQITYQVSSNGKVATITRIVTIKEDTKTFEEVMKSSTEVMSNDPDHNLRYVGSDPSNYVSFNQELWRIIGIFEGQIKMIREGPYSTNIVWDKNETSGGHGEFGWNDWSVSTLQVELNTTFLSSIEQISKSYIDVDHIWTLGGASIYDTNYLSYTRTSFYNKERGDAVASGRPKTWTGAIGLMYPSDYAYAISSSDSCYDTVPLDALDSYDCSENGKNNDWLYDSSYEQWTITPVNCRDDNVFTIYKNGNLSWSDASLAAMAKPVLYLKSEIKIKSGSGTKEEPFILA